jgi:hypothetical protein
MTETEFRLTVNGVERRVAYYTIRALSGESPDPPMAVAVTHRRKPKSAAALP